MKSKVYEAQQLEVVVHMLEHMLQEWKMLTDLRKEVLSNHPWLGSVLGAFFVEDRIIETTNAGKAEVELVHEGTQTLPTLVLKIILPARCISRDEELQWGAFVPNHFSFSQVRPGEYVLRNEKTPYYEMTHSTGEKIHS